jgi:hypothetical protein
MYRPIKTHPWSRFMQATNLSGADEPSAALEASPARRPRTPRNATVPLDADMALESLVRTPTAQRVWLKKRGQVGQSLSQIDAGRRQFTW